MGLLVVGLGNILLQDEGVGVHVVNSLRKKPLPSGVELMDGATMGVDLLNDILESDKVIIVDSAQMGLAAGEIRTFGISDIDENEFPNYSLHDLSFAETIALGGIVSNLPPILIIGIQPESIEPGDELTENLKKNFSGYVDHVYDTILDFNEEAIN
ncbi:MAG: hydrogenase maturation protease [Caldisericia bacterium]